MHREEDNAVIRFEPDVREPAGTQARMADAIDLVEQAYPKLSLYRKRSMARMLAIMEAAGGRKA